MNKGPAREHGPIALYAKSDARVATRECKFTRSLLEYATETFLTKTTACERFQGLVIDD